MHFDPDQIARLAERYGEGIKAAIVTHGPDVVGAVLAQACLAALDGSTEAEAAGIVIDPAKVEEFLGNVAGAERAPETDIDRRGIPTKVWTPDGQGWRPLSKAPAGYAALDHHLTAAYDLLTTRPNLRVACAHRWLPTNEETTEIVVTGINRPIVARVTLPDGYDYEFTVDPVDALVVGSLTGTPKKMTGRR